ncbi:MAG TPA: hypothetical protein VMT60_02650 [Candidatus Bathyarchaeia archaeon]|nr:hypothetical protein [Candidatus Bathyarchaeia archaeon]
MNPKHVSLSSIGIVLCAAVLALVFGFSGHAQLPVPGGKKVWSDSLKNAISEKAVEVLKASCTGCHGGMHPRMQLNLEAKNVPASVSDVPSREIDTLKLVDSQRPQMSYLIMKIHGAKGIKGGRMPLNEHALSAEKMRTLELWARSLSPLPIQMRRHVPDTSKVKKS